MSSMLRTMRRAIAREERKKEHSFGRYHGNGAQHPINHKERRGQYLRFLKMLAIPKAERIRQKTGDK